MGGWNAASGAGTITITFTGAGAIAACCLPDGTCADTDSVDCAAAGGLWDSSSVCADDMCPDLWNGCDGPEYDCDDCWMDGDDPVGRLGVLVGHLLPPSGHVAAAGRYGV